LRRFSVFGGWLKIAKQPLPGSHASAAMIATVTTGKYVDGTPLYRMEHVLAPMLALR
jgi:hypothetical protein